MKTRIVAAGIIGEVLEWYDFTLYGFFTPVLATLFFPAHNAILSLLATFGGFAAGYLTRPLGGFIFGHLGDRFGRKKTLAFTLLLMAIPTCLIGFLPTYAVIGIWAPISLITLRLLQGLSCGGEYSGSIIFLYEHAAAKRQGLFASLAIMGSFIGGMLSVAAVGMVSSGLSHAALYSWGWRMPFIFGILTGIIGFYIRMKVSDTPVFENLKQDRKILQLPIKNIFKNHKGKLLIIAGINIQVAVLSYVVLIYMPTYLTKIVGLPMANVMALNGFTIFMIMLSLPLVGWLSDKINPKFILLFACVGTMIATYPLYTLFPLGQLHLLFVAALVFALLIAAGMGSGAKLMPSLAPPQLRYSCVAVGSSLCDSIFGGMTPLIATFLISQFNDALAPAYYIIFAALITLLVVIQIKSRPNALLIDGNDPVTAV